MTIKAIIFDFDGLILDTETPDFIAWEEIFNRYGLDFPANEYAQSIGVTYDDDSPLEFLKEHMGKDFDEKQLFREFKQQKIELIDEEQLCEGVMDYFHEARQLGLFIGLASSSKREWINHYLDEHEIMHYFDTINTVDDVKQPKPDPELYTRAIEQLGLQPFEALALEDSINGIKSAKNAGLFVAVVPNPVTRATDLSQADISINRLSDITLSKLIERINAL